MRHELLILDGAGAKDRPTPVVIKERKPFKALRAMFKNGKSYAPGDTVMLDEDTAARFRNNGDIE